MTNLLESCGAQQQQKTTEIEMYKQIIELKSIPNAKNFY